VILVDTSVWIDHFNTGVQGLGLLLEEGRVQTHPFVIGELACGGLRNRREILDRMGALPSSPMAEHHEVMHLLEAERLWSRGLGWVDLHLLASARISGGQIWTLDKPLRRVADHLDLNL
jgi:predicted nucleic acid-binding protein